MTNIYYLQYKKLTHLLFFSIFLIKLLNVFQDRISIDIFLFWGFPLLAFYYFVNKLVIRAYQWFCFVLLIYFLTASLRVFGTSIYWIDFLELLLISFLFIHMMFGPKFINNNGDKNG